MKEYELLDNIPPNRDGLKEKMNTLAKEGYEFKGYLGDYHMMIFEREVRPAKKTRQKDGKSV